MKEKINPRFWVLLCIIIVAGIFRVLTASKVLTPLTNFTPIGAMAFFGGCYFRKRWAAYLFPLMALWLSDIFINSFIINREWVIFYDGFIWVYASFALMVWFGHFVKTVSVKSVALLAIVGTVAHWLITDLGVWLSGINVATGLPFSRDWEGLVTCYVLAIPFMKNMLVSNLIFGAIFFGAFESVHRLFPKLKLEVSS